MCLRDPGSRCALLSCLLIFGAALPGTAVLAATVAGGSDALAVPGSGLVAYYPFDGDVMDAGPNGLDGIVSGAVPSEDRDGNADSAYWFDGINDYVEMPNTGGGLDLAGAWSVSVWVRPDAERSDVRSGPVVWKLAEPNSNQDNYIIAFGPDNSFFAGFEAASDDEDFAASGSPGRELGRWYHVAGTYDGEFLRLYVDGRLDSETLVGDEAAYTGETPLRIGNIRNSTHSFRGAFEGGIDDVALYSRALNDAEIGQLAGVPLPAAGWLLLSALLAAGSVRRRAV